MAQQKANGTAEGEWRPDLLDDLSEKMSDAFWVWNASEYDIVAVTAFEAGFEIDSEDCAGQQVTLVGLVGREELNGRKGTVRFYQGPPKRPLRCRCRGRRGDGFAVSATRKFASSSC